MHWWLEVAHDLDLASIQDVLEFEQIRRLREMQIVFRSEFWVHTDHWYEGGLDWNSFLKKDLRKTRWVDSIRVAWYQTWSFIRWIKGPQTKMNQALPNEPRNRQEALQKCKAKNEGAVRFHRAIDGFAHFFFVC